MKRKAFRPRDLQIVAHASEFRWPHEPQFRIGDVVMLNSGGPHMMIVDMENGSVTVAWRNNGGAVQEATFPEPCVHRVALV